ncbi:5-methyltetrahydrofolate--homocysteine s-methyltransferase, putative [Heliomicrobium modesticaldum Ice1]|uniref:5-methyltetrahydrofolate--homocysteine s-methyltransferase, putative n=1 Tax=Heliobacterium modesticaldum (strain ATCC 51547 / Ice1) TaxID=498761 RepID=B0TEN9_HELMI|nr:methyltetrahydrofolate cobalamin methyltransferase [Heliomicrobium modesticaldum]ABZ84291.1 5-methyltetrahydrofolate--homocysteine s-methyltransferase, putative [Heliomicrobium modesticaldum Ice1]
MLIVGEKINTARPGIEGAVISRKATFIQDLALRQKLCGADVLDLNCTTLRHREPDALRWLVETVQTVVNEPVCLDSPNPLALEAALQVHKGRAIINAISAEESRYQMLIPLVKAYDCKVVALCFDDTGVPNTVEEELQIARSLVERLVGDGVDFEDIYVDPFIRSIGQDEHWGNFGLEIIRRIREEFPKVHILCGISNISYGMPARSLLNRTFLTLAIYAGLDGAILDPENKGLMASLRSTETLLQKDPGFRRYLMAFREGLLT